MWEKDIIMLQSMSDPQNCYTWSILGTLVNIQHVSYAVTSRFKLVEFQAQEVEPVTVPYL